MLHPSVKEKQCHKDGLDGGVKNCHLDDDNKEQENNRDRLTDSLGKCIRSPLPKHVIGESVNALHHTFFKVLHRSEEHTSELQSRGHLVCRLLLEKKKQE